MTHRNVREVSTVCVGTIHEGQQLWTKTNETVIVVSVTVSDIIVEYNGKRYRRPTSVIGDKLLLNPPTALDSLSDSVDERETCENCRSYRSQACFGGKAICSSYRFAPTVQESEREHWPKFGDASYMRMKGHSRNK